MRGHKHSLYVAVGCFVVAVLALSQMSCVRWEDVLPQTGEYKLYTTIQVQEDMCVIPDGTEVNGWTKYNTYVRSVSDICVSLQSDDPERTMNHELEHAWRNAVGLDAKARNQ